MFDTLHLGSMVGWLIGALQLDLLGNLLLASVLGAALGLERTAHAKAAGFRTYMLVALGSALLTDISFKMAVLNEVADPLRLPAQIVSGIGFLGAGVIMQAKGQVRGLTTAAGVWVAAGIGIACAAGFYVEAIGTTLLALFILSTLGRAEHDIARRNGVRPAEED